MNQHQVVKDLRKIVSELPSANPAKRTVEDVIRELELAPLDPFERLEHAADEAPSEIASRIQEARDTLKNAAARESWLRPRNWLITCLIWSSLGFLPVLLVLMGRYWPWIVVEADSESALFGTIGDAFGLSNSLFSAVALLLVTATVWLQRREFALQRVELRLTRDEMKASASALKVQAELSALSHLNEHLQKYIEGIKSDTRMKLLACGKQRWIVGRLGALLLSNSVAVGIHNEQVKRKFTTLKDQLSKFDRKRYKTLEDTRSLNQALTMISVLVGNVVYAQFISESVRRDLVEMDDLLSNPLFLRATTGKPRAEIEPDDAKRIDEFVKLAAAISRPDQGAE